MPQRRILFLIDSLKAIGGAEQMFIDQANYFSERGIEVYFATCFPPGITDFGKNLMSSVHYSSFDFTSVFDLRAHRALAQYALKHDIPLIYSYLDFSNNVARIQKIFHPTARIVIVEPGDPRRKTWKMRLFDWCTNFFVYKIFAMGNVVRDNLLAYLAPHRKKIISMRNGVHPMQTESEVRAKLARGKNTPFTIFHVGNMKTENKGHIGMIRAVGELHRKRTDIPFSFILAGDGFMKEHFEEKAREEGIDAYTNFVGSVPHEKIKEYYRAADVFIFNSATEGGAASIMEATSAALPTITSNFDSVREVVVDGETGFIVPRDGIAEFADALIRIHDNDALWKNMAESARKLYERRFMYDTLADRFIEEIFEDN